jgi:predicted dehydrogenase
MAQELGIGVIGMGWMGDLHARSYLQVPVRFPDAAAVPKLVVCADEFAARAERAQRAYGFAEHTTDWREVVDHPEVHVVNVTTPNHLHREMVEAVAAAGKHILCEKPVGRYPEETVEIANIVAKSGVNSHVGYNYRWVPVVQLARQLIERGELGDITHYRGQFLEGYAANPNAMLTWRFQADIAGTGVLGDMMSHSIDMAHMLIGPIKRVVSQQETFTATRPLPVPGEGTHFSVSEGGPRGPVENEDYVGALVEFVNGARGTLESCRIVMGEKFGLTFQTNGTAGALHWHGERMNELEVYRMEDEPERDGFTRILTGPKLPHHAAFTPADALPISYDDLKAIEMYEFLEAIAAGRPSVPGMAEAAAVAEVSAAMRRSWESDGWEDVVPLG